MCWIPPLEIGDVESRDLALFLALREELAIRRLVWGQSSSFRMQADEKPGLDTTGTGTSDDAPIMNYIIAVILLVLWLVGWLGFHLLGGVIHILLGLAIIMFVVGFFKKTP